VAHLGLPTTSPYVGAVAVAKSRAKMAVNQIIDASGRRRHQYTKLSSEAWMASFPVWHKPLTLVVGRTTEDNDIDVC
jgi:hypothetical protein